MVSKTEHKKVAEVLYKKLETAVAALENATTDRGEDKAETRIKALEDKIASLTKVPEQKEDIDVCAECGGDLQFIEDGIVFCSKCDIYYEYEE